MSLHPVVVVAIYGTLTALATGLGALPFAVVRRVGARGIGAANAVASGLMLGASLGLAIEGATIGTPQVIVGGALGLAFVLFAHRLLSNVDVSISDIRGASARKVALLFIVMTLHSFSEGVAVGVSFGGDQSLAAVITIAIAVHNVPEGLAISAVMRPRGASIAACAGWSILSSVPQPLMAVPAFVFVEVFTPLLPYGLGFAAGAMVFVVFFELLPESYEALDATAVGLLVSLALISIVLFQAFL